MQEKLFGGSDSGSSRKFICLIVFIILTVILLITTIIFGALYSKEKNSENQNTNTTLIEYPSPERFIKVLSRISESGGAYMLQTRHDIFNSKYFNYLDIYNMKSGGSLILLEKFKTYQQTSEVSCGPAAVLMAIHYLDGTILDENEIVKRAKTNVEIGTPSKNLEQAISSFGYTFDSKNNYTDDTNPARNENSFSKYIKESLKSNESIIVLSNDWAGHYSVIIGYDDMGTKDFIDDDVIILADPYDTSDHINDGYTIFSYERFYYQMTIKVFGIENQDLNFIRIKRKNSN
jgi:hypothetical protein